MSVFFTSCLICGSDKIKPSSNYQTAFLAKCNYCSFVFSHKIPSEFELINHYKNYPLINEISPITVKRYNELLDKFEKFRKNNTILDVGCGDGFFLDEAKKRNWNVYGTEYREEAVQKCSAKGISMKQGKLSSLNYQPEFFDLITSFEVIEHINNPSEEISAFNKILRMRGGVYLTTPNFNSLSRQILGNKWNTIAYPDHLSYYTPQTIHKLLVTNNFLRKSIRTTGLSLYRLKKSMGSMSMNNEDEQVRIKTETSLFFMTVKKAINYILDLSGTGDTIKILYQKLG